MYQPFDLSGKVSLITGGNGGIGLGFAKGLASAGADVAIWGTNPKKNEAAVAELKKISDTKIESFVVNVADEAAVDKGFADTLKSFGRVDSVFANAGIGRAAKSFAEMETQDYRDVLAVNLDGVFFTLRAAARHIMERTKNGDEGGSLVAVASLAAIEGAGRNQHYGATKGAVASMMRGIAVEYGRYGVRANSILPGWIETDMTTGMQANDAFTKNVIPRIPIKRRWGVADDFSGVAVYLASDASAYHTGDSFVIDGGYSIF